MNNTRKIPDKYQRYLAAGYPPVYCQVLKLKEFWMKSVSEYKDMYIECFDEKLREIEREVMIDRALNDDLDDIEEIA